MGKVPLPLLARQQAAVRVNAEYDVKKHVDALF